MAQRPRDALAQLWFITRLHGKVRQVAVSDGCGPNKYGAKKKSRSCGTRETEGGGHERGEPVDGLDAAGLATGEEAVHAHRAVAGLARGAGGVPGPGPGNVVVGVVAQLESGSLCVRLCFQIRAPGRRTLRECGGEEGGERVRKEGFHFRGVQHRLLGGRWYQDEDRIVRARNERTWRVLSRMSTTTLCGSGAHEEYGGGFE
jgi:hypothetical protein